MNSGNEKTLEISVKPTDSCCHHWMIQSAVGPVSEGSCQNCGEVRVFKNSIDYEAEWTNRRDGARSKVDQPANGLTQAKDSAG
jgi:hypothetical protein